ncbi:MAG: hypothetical protein EZS28_020201 [Streblomastix strix]|uniref:Uncharacterized protein n=1 Tax=Streblomastix strix TaxID=222440 RepID=A0A5J4VNX0_9EUKA|nr:MAG: hypothetical protein EZS28_020201 [Streblomastix strix]
MTVYIDEALLDAAGLINFPEMYAYIRERDSQPPVETAPPVRVGDQTLQDPFVYAEDDREIAANTSIIISTTYYKQQEALKQINQDSNNDGKVDIMDVWNGSGQGTHGAQSYTCDFMKKQSDLIDTHVEGTVLYNFLNNDIKLLDKLGIYKANRAAYYIQDGPNVTFRIFTKIKSLVSKIRYGLSWVKDKIVKPYVLRAEEQFNGFIPGGGLVMKGIEARSSALATFNGYRSKQDAKDELNDLMDGPYLRYLPIDWINRLIKLSGRQS